MDNKTEDLEPLLPLASCLLPLASWPLGVCSQPMIQTRLSPIIFIFHSRGKVFWLYNWRIAKSRCFATIKASTFGKSVVVFPVERVEPTLLALLKTLIDIIRRWWSEFTLQTKLMAAA
ncbi:MAG: hypothetical protein F6K50_00005, partial [Moorea sp. SIO3I7]|nr:hypothetical protein [Moorena sp. SIO3I7]